MLLIFALLVTPAATALQLTARPVYALLLAVALAVLVTWAGLVVAYYTPYPVGFFITTFAFGLYLLTRLGRAISGRSLIKRETGETPSQAGASCESVIFASDTSECSARVVSDAVAVAVGVALVTCGRINAATILAESGRRHPGDARL